MDQPQSRTVRYAVGGLCGLALLLLLGWLILRESPPSPVQSAKFAPIPSSVSPPAPSFTPDETVPHEPATNQVAVPTVTNAAVFYQRAFALYDALTKEEKDLLRGFTNDAPAAELCGKIQPICNLMRQAAAVSNCDWGVEQPITVHTQFPYFWPCINLARTATWGVGHCRTNDAAAAVDDLVATSRLGQHASSPTTFVGFHVDMAIQSLVASCVSKNATLLASTDNTELVGLLNDANYDERLCRSIEAESDMQMRWADALTAMPPEQASTELANVCANASDLVSQIQAMGPAQAIAHLRQTAELEGEYAEVLAMPDAEYDAWMARLDEAGNAKPFVEVFLTPYDNAVDKAHYMTVYSTMAAAGLAVMQDGPDALDSHPDPATGQPFTYTQTDDGFTLESGFQPQGNSQRWPVKLSFK